MKSGIPTFPLLAAALLVGCASFGGLDTRARISDGNQLEAQTVLTQAKTQQSPWPADDWWKSQGDAQLDTLIGEALGGSPSLRIAQARIDQARAQAGLADANRQPQITGALDSTRQRYSENGLIPPPFADTWRTTNRLALDFSYELDFWGKNRAALDAALSRAKAAEVDAQAARLLLTTAIARTYVELDRQFSQLDVAQASLEQRKQIRQLTESRVQSGLDSNVELRQAASAVPAAQAEIGAIEERIALLRNQLAALLGKGPDRGLQIARPSLQAAQTLALPATLPADLIGRRPDVVAQRWRVEGLAKDIDVAKAQFYPDINLLGFVGLDAIGLSNLFKAGSGTVGIGAALRLPIFDGGRLRANLAARNADLDAAVEQYNGTLVDALRDVADQVTSWRAVEAQQAAQRQARSEIEEAHRLALLRYREGLANYLTVLNTETQVLAQRRLETDLRARQLDVSVNLARALGGGYEPTPIGNPRGGYEPTPTNSGATVAPKSGTGS